MKKILIVDDDESTRKSYGLLLTQMGFEVFQASDGLGGLASALCEDPDLIIADYNMPNMNGYEMARQLKSHEKTKHIPILGRGDFQDKEKKILDYYMPKCTGNLPRKIREILGDPFDEYRKNAVQDD
jgi:PleD family two-component response regulator